MATAPHCYVTRPGSVLGLNFQLRILRDLFSSIGPNMQRERQKQRKNERNHCPRLFSFVFRRSFASHLDQLWPKKCSSYLHAQRTDSSLMPLWKDFKYWILISSFICHFGFGYFRIRILGTSDFELSIPNCGPNKRSCIKKGWRITHQCFKSLNNWSLPCMTYSQKGRLSATQSLPPLTVKPNIRKTTLGRRQLGVYEWGEMAR